MRIQETDRILKESRMARHTPAQTESHRNPISRMWRAISALPSKMMKRD